MRIDKPNVDGFYPKESHRVLEMKEFEVRALIGNIMLPNKAYAIIQWPEFSGDMTEWRKTWDTELNPKDPPQGTVAVYYHDGAYYLIEFK